MKVFKTNHNEKYWQLIKIFIFNFIFAHILAVCLSKAATINENNNWMIQKNIYHRQWIQKYIWSYYWAINIMLTVGFGDITAINKDEALILIILETFSCIILAFNINCIGQIILKLRTQNIDKYNKLKIIHKITKQNIISDSLDQKINNYIQQSININHKFDVDQQKKFVQQLPQYLKKQLRIQINKNIFINIPFFRYVLPKTCISLAQQIQMKICHPSQTIRYISQNFDLLILRQGTIGTFCHLSKNILNKIPIDKIKINKTDQPFLISQNFITKKHLQYQIRCIQYSTIYYLQYCKLLKILQQSKYDYQYYCTLRDKISNKIDQFENLLCSLCDGRYHSKFECPKLHFIPKVYKIILKQQKKLKQYKIQQRININRKQKNVNIFQIYRYYKLNQSVCSISQMIIQSYRQIASDSTCQQLHKRSNQKKYQFKLNDQSYQLKNIIKTQLQLLNQQNFYQDIIWSLELDIVKNYLRYFPQFNSNNINHKIESKHLKKKRSKSKNIITFNKINY